MELEGKVDRLYEGVAAAMQTSIRLGNTVLGGLRGGISAVLPTGEKVSTGSPEMIADPETDLQIWEAVITRAAPVLEKHPQLALDLGKWWIRIARIADSYSGKPPKADKGLADEYAWVLQQAGLQENIIAPVTAQLYERAEDQPFDVDRREGAELELPSMVGYAENESLPPPHLDE